MSRQDSSSSSSSSSNSNSHGNEPSFVIELEIGRRISPKSEVEALIKLCPTPPDTFAVFESSTVAAQLIFRRWSDAVEAVVFLWRQRIMDRHPLTPAVKFRADMDSQRAEISSEISSLFRSRIRHLLNAEPAASCSKRIEFLSEEIAKISEVLSRRNTLRVTEQYVAKKKALLDEQDLIRKRYEEFRTAMLCIMSFLDGPKWEDCEDEVEIFEFRENPNWGRIHQLLVRERRRLGSGLPIYGYRKDILQKIKNQQVIVLIGETGSGKSTQLVQFLADSGVAGNGSIVCTQPRKIAAMSLSQRVSEESDGCYSDKFVTYYSSYSSSQRFDSKVTFMTDRSFLQHYMCETSLDRVSCIIVDEAHERSIDTDILLALVKKSMLKRFDLKLIIMSATADADKLSEYFFGCAIYHVKGRNFPVEIKYVPDVSAEISWATTISLKNIFTNCASYVSDALKMVAEIHKVEEDGAILVFLTSQMEIEWACENIQIDSVVALPLHGKLSCEEQNRVFQKYPGKRKTIFATNLAETSLTIPGVKYVIDSGMVKESRFESGSGMNVLRVLRASQSSANQRTGRAGRTEPGKCYRLYSEHDFHSMPSQQEPEIRRVHLGVAVLRILALGIKNVEDFDFVDAPSSTAVALAIRNLIQLGAVHRKNDVLELTSVGLKLVKIGIEPRLGKIILDSFDHGLGREGVVLAAVMANASSIFCRIGNDKEKLKSDCLKIQFCHQDGDLFTLLSVYKKWEEEHQESKNIWCWKNSINAKTMRRCKETLLELENCLQHELQLIIPSYWKWNPHKPTPYDNVLKKVIVSALVENIAMYSGSKRLGYVVALTGQHVQLHPSCSLLVYGHNPTWVVFGEILSTTNQYLLCVTSVDSECLLSIRPPPAFDFMLLESQRMQKTVIREVGSNLLRRFCGKSNSSLRNLVSRIQTGCKDIQICVDVDFDKREIHLFASLQSMEKVSYLVNGVVENELKWLRDECIEKYLFHGGPGFYPSVALFGAGGEIKHLEVEKRYLSVEVFHSSAHSLDDKELLSMFDNLAPGMTSFHKYAASGQVGEDLVKWGKITFLGPQAAENAVVKLDGVEFYGSYMKVLPLTYSGDHAFFPFPALKARLIWPRRPSKGMAIVKFALEDVKAAAQECALMIIGENFVRCALSNKCNDSILVTGLSKDTTEPEIVEAFRNVTSRTIVDCFLIRGEPVQLSTSACADALRREIVSFIPNKTCPSNNFWVEVFPPDPKDSLMKAMITFNGSLHLEAAKALENIRGKVLTGCLPWQKIECHQVFHSSVSCPAPVYCVIRKELEILLERFRNQKGVSCNLESTSNGSFRVKISSNATKTVAELRKPLEQLMKGKAVTHASLTPSVLQLLYSRDGIGLLRTVGKETGTYVLHDRQNLNVKVFGPPAAVTVAEDQLVNTLVHLHENRQLEIRLRGANLPHYLMKEVVHKFGPDLSGLKEMFPGAEFMLNTHRHFLSVCGSKELKEKVEKFILEIAISLADRPSELATTEPTCPICLCEVEDCYKLEDCGHDFCRTCLVNQCEAAARNREGFPLLCAREGCNSKILLVDLRSLLPSDKLEELFRASLAMFVASSGGIYRFCPSPDCPSVYRVADPSTRVELPPFSCGACFSETCTRCHLEYHPLISCEMYKEFKDDPDSSLKEWCKGKDYVKYCPSCGFTIEKAEGCNHVECRCGSHICWVCLECFPSGDKCYAHLGTVHDTFI